MNLVITWKLNFATCLSFCGNRSHMLENGHSNLQTNLWGISLQIFSKYPIQKSRDRTTPPPDLPTLKAYPTPGVGGRFGIFSLKWRERMNLKVPGATLPLGCAILSTRARTVRGVGTTPLRRTRVNLKWVIHKKVDATSNLGCLSNANLFTHFSYGYLINIRQDN